MARGWWGESPSGLRNVPFTRTAHFRGAAQHRCPISTARRTWRVLFPAERERSAKIRQEGYARRTTAVVGKQSTEEQNQ
ncbi:hypothetical protein C2U71_16010 [Burkholderia ubonensis]|nr:hypothetical protein C2U71_16010 [Burkholderia ubonensis]